MTRIKPTHQGSERLIMTLQLQLRRHPFIWFAVLSLLLSWWAWPLYGLGLLPVPVAPFGPFLAALIVLAVTEGKFGVIGLFRRMGRWRVNVIWYLIALATPVVLSAVAVLLNIALGAETVLSMANINGLDVLSTFAMMLLIPGFGGAWEEPGWRGYAVPRLQSGRTALRAAVILGLLIAGWHLPLILVGQVSWTDMIQIIGAVIIFNWLFNNARGSVLIIMLAHASNNTVWSTLTSQVVAEPDFFRQAVLQAVVWCVTAVIVVLAAGPKHLSRRHVKQEEPLSVRREGEQDLPVPAGRS
jgi:membrane protease YdiL (CAAX protease family)